MNTSLSHLISHGSQSAEHMVVITLITHHFAEGRFLGSTQFLAALDTNQDAFNMGRAYYCQKIKMFSTARFDIICRIIIFSVLMIQKFWNLFSLNKFYFQ